MDKPPVDTDRIDDAVLALLFYGAWKEKGFPEPVLRSWKGFDWDAMNRLYEKDLIYNPVGKAKSVLLTVEGAKRAEALFDDLFRRKEEQAA
jgi:hypothetical protein